MDANDRRGLAFRTLLLALCITVMPGLPARTYAAQVQDSVRVTQDTVPVPLAPLVVTASRQPVRSDRIGFAVSVLDEAELSARRAVTVADALRNAAGSFIDESAGPGGPTIVRLRGGEEVFTQILVDGVRINQNGGFFDFQGVTLSNIERIEIARGPQSALYGSSAVSGVIQLLTAAGRPGSPRVKMSADGGTMRGEGGGYRAAGTVTGGSPAVRYAAGLGWAYDRGIYALPHDVGTVEASLRLDATLNPDVELTGSVRLWNVDAMLPVRDAGATRVPLDPNARNSRDRLVSAVGARIGAGPLRHNLRVSTYREAFVYDDRRDNVAAAGEFPFFIFDADFRLDSRLLRTALEYGGTAVLDEGRSSVSWGAVHEREDLEDRTSGEFGEGTQRLDRGSTAAFAEVVVAPVGWLDLIAGARAEKFEGLSTSFTPRASAVLDLSGLIRPGPRRAGAPRILGLRLAAGRGFKAPNLQEQYLENPFIVSNPDLEPETSTSWEVGLDVQSADARFGAGVTFFRQRFEDLIRAVPFDTTGRQQNRNLGASRAHGVEWRFVARPAPAWSFGADGTWVATRVLENAGLPPDMFPLGESLPFRPDVVAGTFLEWQPVTPVRARLRADRVGAQTVLTERFSGRRADLESYVLMGVSVDWTLSQAWQAWVRLDNILGRDYLTAFDRQGVPASGRVGFAWRN